MSFLRSLTVAIEGIGIRCMFPNWCLSFTKRGREAIHGYEELEVGHLGL